MGWERSRQFLRSPDIPFSRDDANRFLPWIIAFMMFLTGLVLSLSLTLNTAVLKWNGDFQHSFTVQIPQIDGAGTATPEEMVALLKANEWAESADEISREDMKRLIEPWLGEGEALDALPLPLLVEVKVREGQVVDIAGLEKRLQKLVPGTEIDDYQRWMTRFSSFSQTVQWGAFGVAVLIVATTLGIVILAAKTALRLHQQTVEILYTIGAKDDYIAEQFQLNAMHLVLKGATVGTLMAVAVYVLMAQLGGSLESVLLPSLEFTPGHVILFIALPVVTASAAMYSTRCAVLALLKRKP